VIILDTNVVSAVMRTQPDRNVVAWLDEQPAESVWTTSVTVFEVRTGIELLETGRRRKRLAEAFAALLEEELQGRVQAFDLPAAEVAGDLAANQQRAGRRAEIRDVQIAGIAAVRRATLATRNLRHFEGLGVRLVDPWAG
jgi:predicted nucleic acid-binding protein